MAIIGISEVDGFARAARELHAAPSEAELLQLAVDLAAKIINGSDYAGISVVQGREISTPVASDDVARRGDALQYQLDEGPSLDAVRRQETVISPNLGEEVRWPEWTPRAVSVLGVQAMMSLSLYTCASSYGHIPTGRSICIRTRLTPSGRMSTRSLAPWPRRSRLRLPRKGRSVGAASPCRAARSSGRRRES